MGLRLIVTINDYRIALNADEMEKFIYSEYISRLQAGRLRLQLLTSANINDPEISQFHRSQSLSKKS